MITTSEFCMNTYGSKLYKICFDAGFSCPNRDGTLGESGCIFCSADGSGDFAVRITDDIDDVELERRINSAKKTVADKYKGHRYIAYFQAFTNTYAPVEKLRRLFYRLVNRDDIAVLSIATRPDCLGSDVLALLEELNEVKPVWVELGLQTVKKESIRFIRRGYDTTVYNQAVADLNRIGIHTITHVILFLPGETEEDMLRTVDHVIQAGSQGIKLQMLQVLKGTDLEGVYITNSFPIPSMELYVEMLQKCMNRLPDSMVVHRMTGDPPKALLIEPKWTLDKKRVLGTIQQRIRNQA